MHVIILIYQDEDNQTVSERQSGKSKKNAAKHVAKPNQLVCAIL
jgi:hypothetical protein